MNSQILGRFKKKISGIHSVMQEMREVMYDLEAFEGKFDEAAEIRKWYYKLAKYVKEPKV